MKISNHAVVLSMLFVAGSLLSTRADTLADWTFETSKPTTSGPFSPETGAGSATGSHVGATAYSNPAGNGSAHSFSSTVWAVGDYYQFQVSSAGYNSIMLSFDQTSSTTGPRDFQLSYSTDGSTFTSFASYSVLTNSAPFAWNATTAYGIYTTSYDLSTISAINNTASVYFRLADTDTTSANGGTVATGGTDRVDNFTVTALAVPEPGTIALAALGGLACLVLRNRRV